MNIPKCRTDPQRACALLLIFASVIAASAKAPLADAAEKADRAAVQTLLAQGADVNGAQADGMTALHWASYQDDLEMARWLVKAKANVQAENEYGVRPLSLACVNGNAEFVELLLEAGADPNTTLHGGESVLMTAARTGKVAPVKALLSRGAQVDAKERRGQTALIWAADEGHAAVVELLIEAGADFRSGVPDSGFTPLCFAAREGRTDVVRALLKAGADVNETIRPRKSFGRSPRKGTSPLILAIESGHFDLSVVLLDAGADPNDQRSGFAPLHVMSWVRKPPRGDGEDGDPPPIGSGTMTSLEFIKALVARGADVNARLKSGKSGKAQLSRVGATPFLLAAATADIAFLRLLIQLGADPYLNNADNCTPLMAAAGIGCMAPQEEAGTEPETLEVLQFLVDLGCDVNAVDENGETAMHGAAYKHFPKVVQLLVDKGAKIEIWNRENKYGWTPWRIAQGYRVGNFRPSAEMMAALQPVMLAAGITPPEDVKPVATRSEPYAAEGSVKKTPP